MIEGIKKLVVHFYKPAEMTKDKCKRACKKNDKCKAFDYDHDECRGVSKIGKPRFGENPDGRTFCTMETMEDADDNDQNNGYGSDEEDASDDGSDGEDGYGSDEDCKEGMIEGIKKLVVHFYKPAEMTKDKCKRACKKNDKCKAFDYDHDECRGVSKIG